MPKKEKKKKEVVVLTPKEQFDKLVNLKKATACIVDITEEYKLYVSLVPRFEKMAKMGQEEPFEGWERCDELAEECKAKAEELKQKLPADANQSRTVMTSAKERQGNQPKKKSKDKLVVAILAVLVVVAGICYKVTPTRYGIAGLEAKAGLHRYAMESYAVLGDYKSSKEKVHTEGMLYAADLVEKQELGTARRVYSHLADLGNDEAAAKELVLEQQLLAKTEIGHKATFGDCRWIVIDKEDGRVLLARDKVLRFDEEKDNGFNTEVFHASSKTASWKDSDLRIYLNGEFYNQSFTENEKAVVLDTALENKANSKYGEKDQETTADKVFIFDETQAETYKDLLKEKAKSIRLRTEGKDASATEYINNENEIVYYGYPIDQTGIYNRPVIWVDTQAK